MRYVLEQCVSHAQVDFIGEQKLSDLLSWFEQAAVEASQACGWGPAEYSLAGCVWIIRRTRVWRFAPVGGLDHLRVETRVADVRRARSLREYCVWRGTTKVAEGVSDWVYYDLERRRPARVPAELSSALYGSEPVPSLERSPHPWSERPEPADRLRVAVRPSDLDHLQHVNNATYADLLDDAVLAWCAAHGWPLPRMLAHGGALRPVGLDVEYLDDAGSGTELLIDTWGSWSDGPGSAPEQAEFVQSVRANSGVVVARAVSHYVWRTCAPVLGRPPR
ncbi:MAG: thioesterase [Candidatus Binatia bacterium]|nr:thioesterase [Candidatus Binatia bacterium]